MITDANRVLVALHHARAKPHTQHNRTLMCDAIELADDPDLVLAETIRRLGRHNALAVELPANLINRAIRAPKEFRELEAAQIGLRRA